MVKGRLFSEPESELTCDEIFRKRVRESQATVASLQQMQQPKVVEDINVPSVLAMERFDEPRTGRIRDSGRTSTSGGSQSLLDSYQNLEIEAFIQNQNQKLRAIVEENLKHQCRWLVWMLQQQTLIKLEEKERELEKVSRVNAELEEKVKLMSAENQMWLNVAKNSEAKVFCLRQSLEQLLLHSNEAIEGFGETDGLVDDAQFPARQLQEPDNVSSKKRRTLLNLELKQRKLCKGCGEGCLSILVLPCRHLSLCKDCDSRLRCCPVCNSLKNASLQIFMS